MHIDYRPANLAPDGLEARAGRLLLLYSCVTVQALLYLASNAAQRGSIVQTMQAHATYLGIIVYKELVIFTTKS